MIQQIKKKDIFDLELDKFLKNLIRKKMLNINL